MIGLKNRLKNWIVETVTDAVVIGGHCGLCGKWVPNCLVHHAWRWTICKDCISSEEK